MKHFTEELYKKMQLFQLPLEEGLSLQDIEDAFGIEADEFLLQELLARDEWYDAYRRSICMIGCLIRMARFVFSRWMMPCGSRLRSSASRPSSSGARLRQRCSRKNSRFGRLHRLRCVSC